MKTNQALALLLALTASIPALAQTERTGSDNARVMQQAQQLQQVTAERAALQAENDSLKAEMEALKAQVARAQGDQSAVQRRLQVAEAAATRMTGSAEANAAALERSRAQTQELLEKFRETADNLRNLEIAKANTETELGTRQREFTSCIDRNVGLYELNSEIIGRMEDRGFWRSLTEREPFTRIARTRLENLIDDYRYRVEELRLERESAAQTANPAN